VLGSPDSSGFPCPTCPVAGLFAALGLVGSFVVGNFALCTNPLGRSLLRNAEVEVYPKTVNVWRPPIRRYSLLLSNICTWRPSIASQSHLRIPSSSAPSSHELDRRPWLHDLLRFP
jgi:hypothetical protein